MRRIMLVSCALAALWVLDAAAPSAADGPYRFIKDVEIGEGGWDYLNVDSAAHRLYVSHASKVVVVDTTKDEIVGEIADTPGVHGAVPAGPDRVSGGQWNADYSREYFRCVREDGMMVWLFRGAKQQTSDWFLHGWWD